MTITKHTEFFDNYNASGNYDAGIKDIKRALKGIAKVSYISSSAWRGYYEATPLKSTGYKLLKDDDVAGWLTGEYEDAPAGTQQADYDKAIAKLDASEVHIIYLPTSNVFSTAVDIIYK